MARTAKSKKSGPAAKTGAKKTLRAGDDVTWESSQGTVHGTVERKLTKRTSIKGHDVAASPGNPEYLVKSKKTGAAAAHKPEALERE